MLNWRTGRNIGIALMIAMSLLPSCTYRFSVSVDPADAEMLSGDVPVRNNDIVSIKEKTFPVSVRKIGYADFSGTFENTNPFAVKAVEVRLEKLKVSIRLETTDGPSEVYLGASKIGTTPFEYRFEYGVHDCILRKPGYADQTVRIDARTGKSVRFSHKKDPVTVKQMGVLSCGSEPKQVLFSPDTAYVFVTLLNGDGFQVFNIDTMMMESLIQPPDPKKNRGFPEGLFITDKNAFLVSQMTTGKIYEYSYPGLEYRRTLSTYGTWSKYLAWSAPLSVIAVSNWLSNTITIIDYETGKLKETIRTASAPRGLAFSADGAYLFATAYEGGEIYKIDTAKWEITGRIYRKSAAMRHVVLSRSGEKAYVSDMHNNRIYELDTEAFEILASYPTDYCANTIDLTPDGSRLFVSCRGPNNPESYLKRSPRNGINQIISTVERKVTGTIEGGNQPTGLDVSADGNYLCTSNFKDNNIELYWIGE